MDFRVYSKKMIKSLNDHLDSLSKYITYPKFVFLCGEKYDKSTYILSNRGIIEKYFNSKSEDVYIVLSELLWEDSFNSDIDLLTFEEFLAEVSDIIILFVESPGSFCELGAFSYAEKLFSGKLIIILDEKHKGEKSFIMTGPVAKSQKDGARIVYAKLDGTGLLSSIDLRKTIDEQILVLSSKNNPINKRTPNSDEKGIYISSFIVELIELICFLQPINRKDLIEIYKKVKGFSAFSFIKSDGNKFHNEIKYDYILKLLQKVNIIKIENDYISCDKNGKTQSLMFTYSKKAENKERNRLICRKYRYQGNIEKWI